MRPNHPLLRRLGLLTAGVTLLGTVATGCDSSARIYEQRVTFQAAEVVSAFPGRKLPNGSWERVCDAGPVDGMLSNITLISSQRRPAAGSTQVDRDQGIRPRDVVETRVVGGGLPDDINLSTLTNIGLTIECIDPVPSPDPDNSACQGASPSVQLDDMRYVANNADRAAGHNVLLLIDQSGSTAGLVNDGSYTEDSPSRIQFPQNFGEIASDRNDERLAAARKLVTDLNDNDRFGAIAFGEGDGLGATLNVPCTAAQGGVQQALSTCFGSNRTLWLGPNAIDALGSREGGRANLWEAVQTAYNFLKDQRDTTRGNHIVVITDGPDTCAPGEGLGACQTGCSNVRYEAVRSLLEQDLNDPNALPIRIHFIQFESLGYPGRDPRQVETACLSGGQYQYLNSNRFPRDQANSLNFAMTAAMNNVRYSLSGHWQLASQVTSWVDSGPSGTRPGSLYALSGNFIIRASSNLRRTDTQFPFGIGRSSVSNIPANWDRRPTARKPCTAATDCGANGEGGPCDIICSEETLTCPNGSAGITSPDLMACDAPSGGSGFCCEGSCESTGGSCGACFN